MELRVRPIEFWQGNFDLTKFKQAQSEQEPCFLEKLRDLHHGNLVLQNFGIYAASTEVAAAKVHVEAVALGLAQALI